MEQYVQIPQWIEQILLRLHSDNIASCLINRLRLQLYSQTIHTIGL